MLYLSNYKNKIKGVTKMILTKSEAVDEYGTPEQINHFNKYGKFVCKRTEEALFKTLEQNFLKVERVKQGRSIVYLLEGKRDHPVGRSDKRSNNGSHLRTPYGYDLDLAIITYMEANRGRLNFYNPKTMASWLLELGVVTRSMHDVYSSRFNENKLLDQFQNLMQEDVLDYGEKKTLRSYIEFHDTLRRNLESSFYRLVKREILTSAEEYWAYVDHYEQDKETGNMVLVESEYSEILASNFVQLKGETRHILLVHDLTHRDLKYKNKKNSKRVSLCEEDLDSMKGQILSPKYKGGISKIAYAFTKKSYAVTASPKDVVSYIKHHILPYYQGYENIELVVQEIVDSYEKNSTYENYIYTMSSFKANKRLALLNRGAYAEKKFKEFIEKENEKIAKEEEEWGGHPETADSKYANSYENGSYYRSLLNNKFSERMLGIDVFLERNPQSLEYRQSIKKNGFARSPKLQTV